MESGQLFCTGSLDKRIYDILYSTTARSEEAASSGRILRVSVATEVDAMTGMASVEARGTSNRVSAEKQRIVASSSSTSPAGLGKRPECLLNESDRNVLLDLKKTTSPH